MNANRSIALLNVPADKLRPAHLGELFRARRLELGLQQKDLAAKAKVRRPYLCRIEKRGPSKSQRGRVDYINAIAEALGLDKKACLRLAGYPEGQIDHDYLA